MTEDYPPLSIQNAIENIHHHILDFPL